MANVSRRVGFQPKNMDKASTVRDLLATSETTSVGDVLWRNSAGLLTATVSTNKVAGIQASKIIDETDGETNATSVAGDMVLLWDAPDEVFVGEISTFTQTDPYTCRIATACFDVAGATGVQYIDAAATTSDTIKVLRLSYETSGKGGRSIAGANAKCEFVINPGEHERTSIS